VTDLLTEESRQERLGGDPNWEAMLWGVVMAGVYDRKKCNCMTIKDEILLEAWEKFGAQVSI